MLEIKDLKVAYGKKEVLHGVSLDIRENEILGIVGESGSGKSTVLHSILGFLGNDAHVLSGSIKYQGQELLTMKPEQRRGVLGKDAAFVFQHPSLSFDPITKIKKQMYETVRVHQKITRKEAEEKMLDMLEQLKFDSPKRVLEAYPFELSGGMCQRVALAIAMLSSPKLLLADEPTSALDVTVQAQVVETMMELQERFRMSIMIVTHNMGIVSHMADRVAVMYQGEIMESGDKIQVLHSPKDAYTQKLIRAVPKLPGEEAEEMVWAKY